MPAPSREERPGRPGEWQRPTRFRQQVSESALTPFTTFTSGTRFCACGRFTMKVKGHEEIARSLMPSMNFMVVSAATAGGVKAGRGHHEGHQGREEETAQSLMPFMNFMVISLTIYAAASPLSCLTTSLMTCLASPKSISVLSA